MRLLPRGLLVLLLVRKPARQAAHYRERFAENCARDRNPSHAGWQRWPSTACKPSIPNPPATPGGDPTYSYRVNLWTSTSASRKQNPCNSLTATAPILVWRSAPMATRSRSSAPIARSSPQVWLMPLSGPGEPHMITDLTDGASAPHWRHDSRALLVTSSSSRRQTSGTPEFSLEKPGRTWWDFDRDTKDEAETGSPDGDLREFATGSNTTPNTTIRATSPASRFSANLA